MRGHDAFESLSGAIVLGEATPVQRARFEAHAHACERCRTDADSDLRAFDDELRALGDLETWRPALRDAVRAKVALARRGRLRAIGTAIASAAVLSLALDLGFSSGALGRIAAGFAVPEAPSSPVAFVPRISGATSASDVAAPVRAAAVAPVTYRAHRARAHRAHAAAVAAKRLPIPAAAGEAPFPTIDVFDGLANDPASESRAPHVAKADPCAPGGDAAAPCAASATAAP